VLPGHDSPSGPDRDTTGQQAAEPQPQDDAAPLGLIKLVSEGNAFAFGGHDIRTSLTVLVEAAGHTGQIIIQPRDGGFKGPYIVGLDTQSREILLGEEYIEIFSVASEESTDFTPVPLDVHGRVADEDTIRRVTDTRKRRREERKQSERARTYRFFFDATPEMLSIAHVPHLLDPIVAAVFEGVKKNIGPYERIGINRPPDKLGQPTNSWIVYVNGYAEHSREHWASEVNWSELKYIVYDYEKTPVRVRATNDLLMSLGRAQCCFGPVMDCEKMLGNDTCRIASGAAWDLVRLPSSVGTDSYRADRVASRQARETEQQAELASHQARLAARLSGRCKRFVSGQCKRGYGNNKKCIYPHGTLAEALKIACTAGSGCTFGPCPYKHPWTPEEDDEIPPPPPDENVSAAAASAGSVS
jgi:hypothetical protein